MHVEQPNPHAAALPAVTARLREAVRKAGGNEFVSQASGVPLRTLSNYLAGGEMKLSKLLDLAAACRVSVAWLVTGEPDSDAPKPAPAPKTALNEDVAPAPRPGAIDVRWLAKAIEIVEALGGEKLPLVDRARRIAHSYELLTAPDADIPPLPPLAPRGR